MSEPNSPVDPRDLDLLRSDPPADPAARARVRSRLTAVFPMGAGGPSTTGGEGPAERGAPPHPGTGGLFASYGTNAIAFIIGGAVGAALYAGLAKPPAPRVVYIDRPAPPPALSVAPPATASNAEVQEVPVAATPAPRAATSKGHASQLSAERLILEEARNAITQGDTRRGLDQLERHRRLFPNPLLAEERDALQVQALVKAGRYDEARASADSFRKRASDSIFMPMVDAAIASIRP
jgi:hypothetical protein